MPYKHQRTIMFHYFNRFLGILSKDPSLRKSLRRNTAYLLRTIYRVRLNRSYNRVIIINLTEHIGDIVACEPVSFHLRKLYPSAFIIWSVDAKYQEIINYNPNIDAALTLSCLTEWIYLKKAFSPFIKIYDLHINAKRCSTHRVSSKNSVNTSINWDNYLNHGNLLQIGAKVAGIVDIPDYAPRFHFKQQQQSKLINADYIVVHTLSNETDRNWCDTKWNDLVRWILLQYPTLHVVEIGLENVIDSGSERYHNFTNKLDLQEIAHVIDLSTLFIGVESGFAHVANALCRNSIVMIGYFQQFRNYKVYSGAFAKEENVTLLYHQGMLKEMSTEVVEKAVDLRISTIPKS